MPPGTLQLILFGLEEVIKMEPSVASELSTLFSGAQPTAADWQALRNRVLAKSYSDYDPGTGAAAQPVPVNVVAMPAPAPAVPPIVQPAPNLASLAAGIQVQPEAPAAAPALPAASTTPPAAPLAPALTTAQLLAATRGGGNPWMQP